MRRLRLPRVRAPSLVDVVRAEARRVVDELDGRRDHALYYWSAFRSKEGVQECLTTGWWGLPAAALMDLPPALLLAADAFFDEVRRFEVWVRGTEAMPATLEARYDEALARLRELLPAVERAVDEAAPPGAASPSS